MRFSALVVCQISEGRVCSDEDFVCEASAETEAGGEAVEAVGVEKISADREVLLKDFPLFLSERILQLGIKVAMLLRKLLDFAAWTDGALTGREISIVKVFQYVRHEVSSYVFLMVHGGKMRAGAVNTWFCWGLVKSVISTRTISI